MDELELLKLVGDYAIAWDEERKQGKRTYEEVGKLIGDYIAELKAMTED